MSGEESGVSGAQPGVSGARPGVSGGWAIFGGTFDPVHLGHLAIAEQAIDELGLAGVLWVPTGMPPHRADRVVSVARSDFDRPRIARSMAWACPAKTFEIRARPSDVS